jgi:predicted DNA-binding protein (MmcQ/YjbR family)
MARPPLSVPEGIRRLALALPEATEEVTWGDVNYRVRKKIFCFPGAEAMTVKADRDELPALLADERVTPAPYLARGGWIAIQLGRRPDWAEVEELITTSYCLIAPKTLGRLVQR